MSDDLVGIWHVPEESVHLVTLLATTEENKGFYFESRYQQNRIWTANLEPLEKSHLKIAPGVLTKW